MSCGAKIDRSLSPLSILDSSADSLLPRAPPKNSLKNRCHSISSTVVVCLFIYLFVYYV